MKAVLLIDFGSTYTKVTAVDLDSERLLGTASAYTTVQTDINEGLENALRELEKQTGRLDFAERFACSSAANFAAGGALRGMTISNCGTPSENRIRISDAVMHLRSETGFGAKRPANPQNGRSTADKTSSKHFISHQSPFSYKTGDSTG